MSTGKDNHGIASKFEGDLLISKNTFSYFVLVAFEAGGPIRSLILLLFSPILCLLEMFHFEKVALQVMIFIAMAGVKAGDIKAVATSVLPRFYLEDIRSSAYKAFSSCGGKKYVVTSMPRIMVEAFLHDYLSVDSVVGTDLRFIGDYCVGLVAKPELAVGSPQSKMLRAALGDAVQIDIGDGDGFCDRSIMLSCQERYIVPADDEAKPLARKNYPKPLIFHDGRLVAKPTPLGLLAVFLWFPMGIVLAILRVLFGVLPHKVGIMAAAATGFRIRAKHPPKPNTCEADTPHSRCRCQLCDPGTLGRGTHTLYVCSHRTLMDPVILATALQRPVTALTYSLSRVSEWISPIRTVRLSRDRARDGETMQEVLKHGDLVVCPEGTTCREPYLLRFSPLFAEIADIIVPVAVETESSMFYGSTVRGYKGLDSFFFLMNPSPCYSMKFLEKLSGVGADQKSSYEFANHVQRLIGNALGFKCTNLTRKDKYMMLAGNDGRVRRS